MSYSEWWRYTNQSAILADVGLYLKRLEQSSWRAANFSAWFDQWGQYLPDDCWVLNLSEHQQQLWIKQPSGSLQPAPAEFWSYQKKTSGEEERQAFNYFLKRDQLCAQWFDLGPKVQQVTINIPHGAFYIFQTANPHHPALLRLIFRQQQGPLQCMRYFAPPAEEQVAHRGQDWYPQALWIDRQEGSGSQEINVLDHQPWSALKEDLVCSSWSTCTSNDVGSVLSLHQWPQYPGVLKNHVYLPLTRPEQRVDYASLLELQDKAHQEILVETAHLVGHTYSSQELRAMLQDESTSIQRGKITMSDGAAQSAASHHSHHLSLSTKARTVATPELAIAVDDVKCSHGSTNGHLSEEDLFFLCSRGLSREQASRLLTQAFSQRFLLNQSLRPWEKLIKAQQQLIKS